MVTLNLSMLGMSDAVLSERTVGTLFRSLRSADGRGDMPPLPADRSYSARMGADGRLTVTETGAAPDRFLVEAEDLQLSGYSVEEIGFASGGEVARLNGGSGRARYVFGGEGGSYTLNLAYIDESDGEARIDVLVDGREVRSVVLDGNRRGPVFGAVNFGAEDRRILTVEGLDLQAGSVIEIRGRRDSTLAGVEYARIDTLELVREDPPTLEVVLDLPAFLTALEAQTAEDAATIAAIGEELAAAERSREETASEAAALMAALDAERARYGDSLAAMQAEFAAARAADAEAFGIRIADLEEQLAELAGRSETGPAFGALASELRSMLAGSAGRFEAMLSRMQTAGRRAFEARFEVEDAQREISGLRERLRIVTDAIATSSRAQTIGFLAPQAFSFRDGDPGFFRNQAVLASALTTLAGGGMGSRSAQSLQQYFA